MAIHRDSGTEAIIVDVLKRDISVDLDGLHTSNVVRDVLEGKDFDQLESIGLIVAASIDRAMGEEQDHPTTHVHNNVFKLWRLLDCKHTG